MAVTTKSRSFVLTALNDIIAQTVLVEGISLVGTGMTVGSRLTLTDNDGSTLVDHYVENANENVEFLQGCHQWFPGIKMTAAPTGTFTVVVRYS